MARSNNEARNTGKEFLERNKGQLCCDSCKFTNVVGRIAKMLLFTYTGTIANEISRHIDAEFGSPITLTNYHMGSLITLRFE